jgi:predicted nucleotidyltransferase
MAKAPNDPKEIFEDIIDDYKEVFGDDLKSIILYGSATGGSYIPGKSDINFMILVSEAGIEHLDRGFKTVAKWRKRKVAVPLFLTQLYVDTSLDVYPIEYLNFQRHHILVYGVDILKDLAFNHDFLRLQCEREIKGKLLLLRKAFLETSGKKKALQEVINQSLTAFIAIFEALLFLQGKEVPSEKRELIRSTCELFDLDSELFEKLLFTKEQRIKPDERSLNTLFKTYLSEVRKLSKLVDALGG